MSLGVNKRFSGLLPFGTWWWIAVNTVGWAIGVWAALFLAIGAEYAISPPNRGRDYLIEELIAPLLIGLIFAAILAGAQWLAFGRRLGSGWRWIVAAIVWWSASALTVRLVAASGAFWLLQGPQGLRSSGILALGLIAVVVPWLVLRPEQPWAKRWCLTNIAASFLGGVIGIAIGGFLAYILLISPINEPYFDGLGILIGLSLGGPVYGAITRPAARRIANWADNKSGYDDNPARQRPEPT